MPPLTLVIRQILRIRVLSPPIQHASYVTLTSEECRRTEGVRPFKKLVAGVSRHEDGLQLADMLAGAVRLYVAGHERDYFPAFEDRVLDLWQPGAA